MALVGFTSGLCDAILNSAFRNTAFTQSASVNMALYTADPLEVGTSNEVSGGSYARQAVTFGAPQAGTGTGRKIAATGSPVASFTVMPACTVTHFGLWSAGGVFLAGGPLGASQALLAGDTYNVTSCEVALD